MFGWVELTQRLRDLGDGFLANLGHFLNGLAMNLIVLVEMKMG